MSNFVGLDPSFVSAVRNQVGLAGQLWHPKTMIGVCRQQRDVCGDGMSAVAYRNMQLVGCSETVAGVSELPPELVAYRYHFDRVGRKSCVLNRVDHTGCCQ